MGEIRSWISSAKQARLRWLNRAQDVALPKLLGIALDNWSGVSVLLSLSSLAIVHVVFFFFNIEPGLWAFIDASLVLGVIFFFGLVFAVALLLGRATPPIVLGLTFFIQLVLFLPIQTLVRLYRSKVPPKDFLRERVAQLMPLVPEGVSENHKLKKVLQLLSFFSILLPTPGDTVRMLATQARIAEQGKLAIAALQFALPVSAICHFYTGWWYLIWLLGFLYVMLFLLIAVPGKLFQTAMALLLSSSGDRGVGEIIVRDLSRLDAKTRSDLIRLVLVLAGAISASSGYYHFHHVANRSPTWIALDNRSLLIKPVIFASGMVFGITADGAQVFIPLEAIRFTCSSGDALLLQPNPCELAGQRFQ